MALFFSFQDLVLSTMWWKLVLLAIYLAVLFVLSRILEAVSYYQGGYLSSRLLDPVSLSVRKLKAILDQRGVSYTGVVERHELTDLVKTSGELLAFHESRFMYLGMKMYLVVLA